MRKRRDRARNPNQRLGGRPGQRPNVVSLVKNENVAAPTESTEPVNGEPGPVERWVRVQCENSSRAADRPGDVAAAIRLAQLADREDHSAVAATNIKNMHVIMASLAGPASKIRKSSKLGNVISMTEPKRKAGSA
jgi:hypothetical protein